MHIAEGFTSLQVIGVLAVAVLGLGVADRVHAIDSPIDAVVMHTPREALTSVVAVMAIFADLAPDAEGMAVDGFRASRATTWGG